MFIKSKLKEILALITVLFILSGCSIAQYENLTLPSGQIIKVKLARSSAEFVRGLSGLKSLNGYDGMFFISPSPYKAVFWMTGMQFPLDIIYLDKNLTVTEIFPNNQPCVSPSCPLISSQTDKVSYILEIPAGQAEKYRLTVGTKIKK